MIRNYIQAGLENFVPNTTPGVDVFIRRGSDYQLLLKSGLPVTEEVMERLKELGDGKVFIAASDEEGYQKYQETILSMVINDPDVPARKKCHLVYSTTTSLMKSLFADPRSGDLIQRSRFVIQPTVDLILNEPSAFPYLMSLTSHDYYTYTHSVNVTVFSVALAQRLFGTRFGHDYHRMGFGFLLHDIGKSEIDPSIINKAGKLDPKEWEEMKGHPQRGYELLKDAPQFTEEVKVIVLQHHEKYKGGGYPDGLEGEEIHPFGRVCCLADVFDALTTRRSYKDALPTFEALMLMKEKMEANFDPEYFHEFVLLFQEAGSKDSLRKKAGEVFPGANPEVA
jgi:HD-GYP domain-containing protein (c-di-GMP phosphodiesterase class II)